MRRGFEVSEERVRLALSGRSGEVLRVIAAQPYRSWGLKHLVNPAVAIPVVRP